MRRVLDGLSFIMFATFCVLALLFIVNTSEPGRTTAARQVAAIQSTQNDIRFKTTSGLPDPNAILQLVNSEREERGLNLLRPNQDLEKIAQARAEDMSKNTYYAHKNTTGGFYDDIMRAANIQTTYSCENLNMSFVNGPSLYVRDWLLSDKGHRQCLLNSQITDAGYAVAILDIPNGQSPISYVVVAIHSTEPR